MGKLEGALVCFVSIIGLTFLFGWIPVIGFPAVLYLGGLIGGLVAGNVKDGIMAGLVGGFPGSIIASILLVFFLSAVFPIPFLDGPLESCILVSIPFALISCIGGAVGGAINKETPSRRSVSPPPPPSPPTAPPTQNFCSGCGAKVQPDAIYAATVGRNFDKAWSLVFSALETT